MMTKLKPFYCTTCNKIFKAVKNNPYYTTEQFVDNQISLIFSIKRRHRINNPPQLINCPFCYSTLTVNVKEILNMFIVNTKTGKRISFNRLYEMKQYRHYAELHRKILKKIGKKSLNTATNKLHVG